MKHCAVKTDVANLLADNLCQLGPEVNPKEKEMFTTTVIRVGFTALVMLCATSQAQQPAPQTTSLESAFYNRQYEQVAEALAAQKTKILTRK